MRDKIQFNWLVPLPGQYLYNEHAQCYMREETNFRSSSGYQVVISTRLHYDATASTPLKSLRLVLLRLHYDGVV